MRLARGCVVGRLATWWVTAVVTASVAVPSAPSSAVPVPEAATERAPIARPSVDIRVRPETVTAGEPVVVRGTVRHAAPRARVRLETRAGDGWRRVAVARTNRSGRYDFTAVPQRGDSTLRVLLPRRKGQAQARSRRVSVRATWTPALSLTRVSYDAAAGGGVTTSAAGAGPELAGALLERQRRLADGTWATVGTTPVAGDGSWADTVVGEPGSRLRWVAPADGARQAVATSEVTVAALPTPPAPDPDPTPDPAPDPAPDPTPDPTPDPDPEPDPEPARRISRDTSTTVDFEVGQEVVDLVVDLDAGQRWTWVGPQWLTVTAVDPSGHEEPVSWDADTHTAAAGGDHTLRLVRDHSYAPESATITLSTPRVVPVTVDGPPTDLASTLTGQLVEVVFDGDAGQVVSEHARPPETGALPRSTPTLVAPSGAVVPRWGRLVREGHVWRLPETGAYTLRFTPPSHDVVDRPDQVVLSARVADVTLDQPDLVSLEQPGRVAVVRTTVPAGLTVTFSDDGPAHLAEELFGPDGAQIDTYATSPTISPTLAGTYTQLVSSPFEPAQVRYFASAPGTLTAAVDGPAVAYDMAGVPDASTDVRVPIATAEQVFSVEVLDSAGELCARQDLDFPDNSTLWTMVSPSSYSGQHPPVLWTYRTGDLVMSVDPCDDTGTIRVVTAVVAPEAEPVPTPISDTDTRWTTDVDVAASTPGQVTVIPYDAGPSVESDRVDVSFAGSTFAADTLFHVGWSRGDSPGSTGGPPGTAADFSLSSTFLFGETTFFVYAGPRATGTATLRVERYDS